MSTEAEFDEFDAPATIIARVQNWYAPTTDAFQLALVAERLTARLAEVEAERDALASCVNQLAALACTPPIILAKERVVFAGTAEHDIEVAHSFGAMLDQLYAMQAERDEARTEAKAALESLTALAPSSLGAQLAEQRRLADVALIEARDLRVELEAARPVVEAAAAWREQLGGSREVMVFGHLVGAQSKAMIAAVDLYRSATSDHPSTTEEKP